MIRFARTRGNRWVKIRNQILERDEFMCQCSDCKGVRYIAHEVDHILPLYKGGTDDPENLMAMNRDCHERKTRTDLGHRERKQVGLDGWHTG